MFWALDAGRVETRGLEFEQVVSDIQTLNEWALEGRLEVSAISMGAYPYVADRYLLLPHGASLGLGYGPVEQAEDLLGRQGAGDALVLQDLVERSTLVVLADHVLRDQVLLVR